MESWQIFDQIAVDYDRINRILSLGMDKSWRKKLIQALPDKKNIHLLDLATGTADQLLSLLNSSASIESVWGIDLSKEMLEIGKKKMGNRKNVHLSVADAQKLPFKENSFDVATFSFGIRNVPNPIKALKEIYRTLKPQGKALILEFSLPREPIKSAYLLYLRHILPRLGGYLSKNKEAYTYLNRTIESFPYGDAFKMLMKQAGFTKVDIQVMALGAVSLYEGTKG